MFPLATISWLGAIVLCVAVGWIMMGAGRCAWRTAGRFSKVIAIAAIIGGLYLFFGHARDNHEDDVERYIAAHVGPDVAPHVLPHVVPHVLPHIQHLPPGEDLEDAIERHVEAKIDQGTLFGRNFSVRKFPSARAEYLEGNAGDLPHLIASEHIDEAFREGRDAPNWMLITLGAVLLIGGWLLVRRDGTRPVAYKALTALGLAATCVILYTLFHAPSESARTSGAPILVSHSNDRVIKLPPADRDVAAARQPAGEAKRPTRAKRPIARPTRPVDSEHAIDSLPPRAGEIPVAAELAGDKAATAEQADAAKEPAAETEVAEPPAAPSEPSEPAEPQEPTPPSEPSADAPVASETEPSKPAAETEPAAPPAPAPEAQPAAGPASETKPADPPPAEAAAVDTPAEVTPADPFGPRPDWVETPGKLVGSVYRVAVESGLYAEVPLAQHALDHKIKEVTDRYIDDYLAEGAAALVDVPREFLREHIKRAEYHEVVQSESVGPMHQLHALVEFDDDARATFEKRWRAAIVSERLWYVGLGGAVILALLSTFWGYLQLDMQTGGAHKGRLQLAATLVALIVAAGALLARWAVPF